MKVYIQAGNFKVKGSIMGNFDSRSNSVFGALAVGALSATLGQTENPAAPDKGQPESSPSSLNVPATQQGVLTGLEEFQLPCERVPGDRASWCGTPIVIHEGPLNAGDETLKWEVPAADSDLKGLIGPQLNEASGKSEVNEN